MNYKIVELEERIVAGITSRTNNSSPEMGSIIGGTWKRFFAESYGNISDKTGKYTLGIYTDYSSDEKGEYIFMAGCEVASAEENGAFEIRRIPAGKYAEFEIIGDMDTSEQLKRIGQLWQEIWTLDLQRSYICDFEEYRSADPNMSDIHIYIGLK